MVNRDEEKVRVHIIVVPRSTRNTNGEQRINAPINIRPLCAGTDYPWEFDSESLPQCRDFDTCRYPRVGNGVFLFGISFSFYRY